MKIINTIKIRIVAKLPESIRNNFDKKEIVKGAGTTFSLKLIGLFFSYVFNILLARMYGADVLGVFALTLAVSNIFMLFTKMGVQTSIVRFVAQFVGQKKYSTVGDIYKKTLYLIIPISIIFSSLLFFSSPWIALTIFHKPILTIPLRITAFAIPFGTLISLNTGALQGLKKIKEAYFFTNLFPPLLNTIGLITLTFLIIQNYLTPIYVNLITLMVGAVFSLYVWKKQIINKLKKPHSKQKEEQLSLKEIVKVSFPMFMTSAMLLIMGWTDTFMLGLYQNTSDVGVYRVVLKTAVIIGMVYISVNSITSPKFSELFWSGKNEKIKEIIIFAGKLSFLLATPILITFIIFGKQILLIFGHDFEKGFLTLIILSIGQYVSAVYGVFGYLLNMTGKEKLFRNTMFIAAFFNIIFNAILIPIYGNIGAAFSTALSTIIMNVMAFYYARNKLDFKLNVLFMLTK